jgi:hypothetical protein
MKNINLIFFVCGAIVVGFFIYIQSDIHIGYNIYKHVEYSKTAPITEAEKIERIVENDNIQKDWRVVNDFIKLQLAVLILFSILFFVNFIYLYYRDKRNIN